MPASPRELEGQRFDALREEWNGLVDATYAEPFYRHEYIGAFLRSFVPEAPLEIVTVRDAAGRLLGALPLAAQAGSICGLPVRELRSPTNVHSFRFDLLAGSGAEDSVAHAVLKHVVEVPGWDVVTLTDIPPGARAWRIYHAAQKAGYPTGVWESQRSPYIPLTRPHEDLMSGLRTKFRANLRRRRKRLGEIGEVTFEDLCGERLVEHYLDECLALESSGWKGRQGSAAKQSAAVHSFHHDLFRSSWHHAHLHLYRLNVGGRTIAFHYGIVHNGVFSLVMTTYDESFAEFSPGQLLTEDVLRECAARGLREFDFLGCDLPWKLEWTNLTRPHHWLFIFRNRARGRFLRRLKFQWAVTARHLLTKTDMHLAALRTALGRSK